jgi:hypothetical protein
VGGPEEPLLVELERPAETVVVPEDPEGFFDGPRTRRLEVGGLERAERLARSVAVSRIA